MGSRVVSYCPLCRAFFYEGVYNRLYPMKQVVLSYCPLCRAFFYEVNNFTKTKKHKMTETEGYCPLCRAFFYEVKTTVNKMSPVYRGYCPLCRAFFYEDRGVMIAVD